MLWRAFWHGWRSGHWTTGRHQRTLTGRLPGMRQPGRTGGPDTRLVICRDGHVWLEIERLVIRRNPCIAHPSHGVAPWFVCIKLVREGFMPSDAQTSCGTRHRPVLGEKAVPCAPEDKQVYDGHYTRSIQRAPVLESGPKVHLAEFLHIGQAN